MGRMDMHRKGQRPSQRMDGITGGGWPVVYTGFVLILLSFFIMLSSFATFEQARVLQFVASFSNALNVLPGGTRVADGQRVAPPGDETDAFQKEMNRLQAGLRQWTARHEMDQRLEMVLTDEAFTLRFDNRMLFSIGSAALAMKMLPLLDRVGASISATDYPVRIEGHTDNVPIRTRRYPSNWELSTARAVNVLRYLIQHCDIPAYRLTAVGCGAYQPLDGNDSYEGRARNRRVEIIFYRGEHR